MEHLNIITDCLNTLYLNHFIDEVNCIDNPTSKLISNIVSDIPISVVNGDMNYDADSIEAIRKIVNDMLYDKSSSYYKYDILMLKLNQTCRRNPQISENIKIIDNCTKEKNIDELKAMLYDYTTQLKRAFNDKKIRKMIRDFSFSKTNLPIGDVDWCSELRNLTTQITPLVTNSNSSIADEPYIYNVVDFDSDDTINDTFIIAAKSTDPKLSLKTPYKRLNKLFGESLGIARPKVITVASCTHNYKTGLMIDLYMGIPRFNKPVLMDVTKEPLILYISLENETSTNITMMYKLFKEQETGVKINVAKFMSDIRHDPEKLKEATNYIQSKMHINGWKAVMLRIDPSDFDYTKLFSVLDYYQNNGFEIVTLIIDYITMMSKKGCYQSTVGSDSRDLIRIVRNYCMTRYITLITPLQLSTSAKELRGVKLREEGHNPLAFINILPQSNMYDTCRSLEHDIDVELFMDIITIQGKRFLAITRGKHRGLLDETPVEDLTFILPFSDTGRILPDVDLDTTNGYSTVREAKIAMGCNEGGEWDYT